MQVLTKEVGRTASVEVINSNFALNDDSRSAITRLKNGLYDAQTKAKIDVYEAYPQPKILSADDKRQLLNITFKLGNRAVYNDTKENIKPDFVHSYTLKFIVIDPKLTINKDTVISYASKINSFSANVYLK